MGKQRYKVDYHLICVVFFADELPSGSDIAKVWTSLRMLGDYRTEMSIKRKGDKAIADLKKGGLGSSGLYNALRAKGKEIDLVGASAFRPDAGNAITDSDVNFSFKRDSIWYGMQAPGSLNLSISGQVIEQAGKETVLRILKLFFQMADHCSPFYGLVDVASPEDAVAGMVYDTCFPRPAPLHRWVEQMAWIYSAAKRRDCVRGLYWGNYFGPKILDRLGGGTAFLQTCEKHARNHDGTANALQWGWRNGVFFSLCLDPLDCRPRSPTGPHPAAESNLHWLIRELGSKGIKNQW